MGSRSVLGELSSQNQAFLQSDTEPTVPLRLETVPYLGQGTQRLMRRYTGGRLLTLPSPRRRGRRARGAGGRGVAVAFTPLTRDLSSLGEPGRTYDPGIRSAN